MILCYVELIIMTFLGAIASLYLKKASSSKGLRYLLTNVNFFIGGVLYAISGVINIWILKFLDYSVVLPLTSLTYMWTMIMSYFLLNETISKKQIFGVCFILIGAFGVSF